MKVEKDHGNVLADIPSQIPQELEQVFLENDNVLIKRIVSKGQKSPASEWYEQSDNEWVLVLQGEAILEFENGEDLHMQQGAFCFIPAQQKHRVKWTAEDEVTIWLAIHFTVQDQNLNRDKEEQQ
ncbi:MAG: cupin domain-containing protein [Gammaproteobacteria bacterium]|jgi:cupin 2 domain-containing protein|nr:cupin domain-containing protein [Gammaproteobacteria bacterium]MBT6043710.1 cupin domain-containing protein [Gammaproteobacteria bacterium]